MAGGGLTLIPLTVLTVVIDAASTTALSVVERVREAGPLRADGIFRGRLTGALLLEAAPWTGRSTPPWACCRPSPTPGHRSTPPAPTRP
ncbi:hypothetical protein [Streptomyces daghestanicus]|jgi:hypothetical protein|uniref:Uncharacterized protein n=1 Tax=Streptomyces daghestanicus TaxID=66885 RepID=A0ABQ3PYB6_9ACTN|nr:hypothetical protein [Streptomyces daghestanicus]GGU63707.1 hypothetical protein GCM10010259_62730 [Streptomyces daghestanicus]GHI30030.1 hypothetical protein Sdagh_17600 [Streptomyces daghestanicus]